MLTESEALADVNGEPRNREFELVATCGDVEVHANQSVVSVRHEGRTILVMGRGSEALLSFAAALNWVVKPAT
ncbi:MAG: hypothetical protein RSG92_15315 [Pseudomonas sp.]